MSSVFTKIIERTLPASRIYEDEQCIVIKTIEPMASLHWLIIPKEEIPSIAEMEERHAPLMGHLLFVSSLLAKQYTLPGYALKIHVGAFGGQEIMHVHVHMMADITVDEILL